MGTVTSLLGALESYLSGLVEGTLERLFKTKVQPVHLARRLDKAMEEGVLVSVDGLLAPNYFVIALDQDTYSRFEGALGGIQRELERHLVVTSARLTLRNLDQFKVELKAEPSLREGAFIVEALFHEELVENESPLSEAPNSARLSKEIENTQTMPALSPDILITAPAVIDVLGTSGPARRVPLNGDHWTFGRGSDNNVVILESAVSRHHAAIRKDGRQFIVEDTDSTNGVFLNGVKVKNAKLKDGDHILIGTVEIVFRQTK